ncbi:hypothetical protein AWB92_15560 [Mycobacterium sp. IEC1808]|uniref:hypothetical protein n=1 Tax=Mycobacterium sp. IEC1808 TaxID=1743230 RepID=UPI000A15F18C|nr:hypothetical protein [Mycobacterium sp. IEC1808]ORW92615.1 hypothetical protein AWB92_15560 [Mycobacterium sp. IEC1808]
MRRVLLVVTLLVAALGVPPARSFAATGCAPGGDPPPSGAAQRKVGDIDWDGQPDTLWVGQFRDGGRTARVAGVTTASGANSGVEIASASPIPLSALAFDAQQDGQHQIIVSDGRSARLYVFADCRLQAAADNQGAPFLFDLANLRGNGTGIGCSDLGPPSPGRHLVGLQALNQDGQWTVRRTEINLNGTLATIGKSDTVAATSAQDPAVISAQTISCGDLTISKDGVQQP